jgi:hypothetical protein
MYLSSDKVMSIWRASLHGKWAKSRKVGQFLADSEYWAAPEKDYWKIINKSTINEEKWISEKHDCDDFAHLLKADFIVAAYKDGKRRRPYCFGIVWGDLPKPHAINWYITDQKIMKFCEPMNDTVFPPRPNDKGIYLILG